MPRPVKGQSKSLPVTSGGEVRRLAGPVSEVTIAAILKAGATMQELEIAAAYASGDGEWKSLGRPLSGKVAQLYDILTADDLYAPEEP
jgi:hypothetical protein